ncbi:hypothetical protein L798_13405 [Zootermopsis nevadensis]|uniref:Uncharacterized protein n=1 Tax=Zootermopsis nevadensis TaxID=136037 RepID=A0A067R3D5_ZOONE|nr:hypothetical protein L798_13405 [Zootermopsis nevadensis]
MGHTNHIKVQMTPETAIIQKNTTLQDTFMIQVSVAPMLMLYPAYGASPFDRSHGT